MATYYALTTQNSQMSGWSIVAHGTDQAAVREDAYRILSGRPDGDCSARVQDIYLDTELKNLRIVSKTRARRCYGINDDVYYDYLADLAEGD